MLFVRLRFRSEYETVPDTPGSMGMSSSSSNTRMAGCGTPTTPITGMTVSSAKRVSISFLLAFWGPLPDFTTSVWVSELVVKELKRIVEASEIVKCVSRPSSRPLL